jgi:hypothetical protein
MLRRGPLRSPAGRPRSFATSRPDAPLYGVDRWAAALDGAAWGSKGDARLFRDLVLCCGSAQRRTRNAAVKLLRQADAEKLASAPGYPWPSRVTRRALHALSSHGTDPDAMAAVLQVGTSRPWLCASFNDGRAARSSQAWPRVRRER